MTPNPVTVSADELRELDRTAPERIWLQISDDDDDRDQPFPHNGEVSWCADSVVATEVEYVRADLAALRQGRQSPDEVIDAGLRAGGFIVEAHTVWLMDRDDLRKVVAPLLAQGKEEATDERRNWIATRLSMLATNDGVFKDDAVLLIEAARIVLAQPPSAPSAIPAGQNAASCLCCGFVGEPAKWVGSDSSIYVCARCKAVSDNTGFEADRMLLVLGLEPDRYRTDGGTLNLPRIKAALKHPNEYVAIPAGHLTELVSVVQKNLPILGHSIHSSNCAACNARDEIAGALEAALSAQPVAREGK